MLGQRADQLALLVVDVRLRVRLAGLGVVVVPEEQGMLQPCTSRAMPPLSLMPVMPRCCAPACTSSWPADP